MTARRVERETIWKQPDGWRCPLDDSHIFGCVDCADACARALAKGEPGGGAVAHAARIALDWMGGDPSGEKVSVVEFRRRYGFDDEHTVRRAIADALMLAGGGGE
jgi:hypothetical protein